MKKKTKNSFGLKKNQPKKRRGKKISVWKKTNRKRKRKPEIRLVRKKYFEKNWAEKCKILFNRNWFHYILFYRFAIKFSNSYLRLIKNTLLNLLMHSHKSN